MSSNKQFRDKRESVEEHPLSPNSLRIEEDEFADINDNPMVKLLSAQHRPLSRPTAATGAIPKDTNYNNPTSARRQFHSRPFPLPDDTTFSEVLHIEEGESSHKVRPTRMEDIPRCGPDFEQLLRKLKPRLDLINQLPVDEQADKVPIEAASKDDKSETSENSSKTEKKKNARQLSRETSQIPCGSPLRTIRQDFDFNCQPGHRPVNQIGGPYHRVQVEEVHYSPRKRIQQPPCSVIHMLYYFNNYI